MQTLRDHFNTTARRNRRKAEEQRERDMDFFILWFVLFVLIEQQRQQTQALQRSFAAFKPR